MTNHRLLATGTALLTLAGCSVDSLPPIADYHPAAYRLGSGDEVRVIVYGEDQLTGEYRVDDQGRIAVPLLGGISATGETPEQLEAQLTGDLTSRNLLRNPSVSVEVLAYRPIFVLGEVAKPGQYPYQPGMTLLTSVAVAGGFTYRAVKGHADVVRTTDGTAQQGTVTPLSFIAPGDVITVRERHF